MYKYYQFTQLFMQLIISIPAYTSFPAPVNDGVEVVAPDPETIVVPAETVKISTLIVIFIRRIISN